MCFLGYFFAINQSVLIGIQKMMILRAIISLLKSAFFDFDFFPTMSAVRFHTKTPGAPYKHIEDELEETYPH